MITLLLACSTLSSHHAAADEATPDTVRELSLSVEGNGYTAAMPSPAPVIVACEAEDGSLHYGPAEDVSVMWIDGTLRVHPGPTYVDCTAWAWR